MPFLAIFRHDVRRLASSLLVKLWFVATVVLTLLLMAGRWKTFPTPPLIATLVFPYLVLPWSLVVMILSVRPVAGSEAEAVADGILSRPVTRYEYMLASWCARVTVVLAVFLLVVGPAMALVTFAKRPVPEDPPTLYGAVAAVGVVALVLTFLVSLGFFLGTLLQSQWVAVTVLVFLWLPVNMILNTFSLEEISPISLTRALPTLLRQPWRQVEPTTKEEVDLESVAEEAAKFFTFFGGAAPPEEPKRQRKAFFDDEEFQDFRLSRVVLGYGLPSLLALFGAVVCFNRRDL